MNIAITTAEATLDSMIFPEFARTPFLLIVNVESMACTPIAHTCRPGSDQDLARMVLEHNCEAVLTGTLSEESFRILADQHVTRYVATGMSAHKALDRMERRELDLIRNAEGTDACVSTHHGLEELQVCNGRHH